MVLPLIHDYRNRLASEGTIFPDYTEVIVMVDDQPVWSCYPFERN